MKSLKYIIFIPVLCLLTLFTGCQENYVTYSDAEYVMFPDTLLYTAVEKDVEYVKVPVASTVKCDHDRTFGVEVIDSKSNAIENLHYALKSNTVTIKAGETSADLLVHGMYDNMQSEDSLCVTLRLVMDDRLEMPMYGSETRVQLKKVCPFNIEDFTGWCVFTSLFHKEFNQPFQRLVKTEAVGENTINCKNMFAYGYDVELSFNNDNILNPIVTMPEEQIISDEASIFGQTLGDDHIRALHSPLSPSNFFTSETKPYLSLWSMVYVKNLGEMVGVVGHFYSVMEWISDEEARRLGKIEGLPGYFE